jgi:hypothetical protein
VKNERVANIKHFACGGNDLRRISELIRILNEGEWETLITVIFAEFIRIIIRGTGDSGAESYDSQHLLKKLRAVIIIR